MDHLDYDQYPHRRYNLLTGEWVLVSPQRTKRPWGGIEEPAEPAADPSYLEDCYLCPGNIRAEGQQNPTYQGTFVFTNDYSALLPEPGSLSADPDDLLRAEAEPGICRVICYSPRHDLTISRMAPPQVRSIIDAWIAEYLQLGSLDQINHVQIFENRGQQMGCSNPHPHGQIWANSTIPTIPARESSNQNNFMQSRGRCLLCSYLGRELEIGKRLVTVNRSFVALVPFWAVWPFETMILPRQHQASIDAMSALEKQDLADIMIETGIRYDNLFKSSFPYSMGIHQQPTDGILHPAWHWHIHYLPPLLRSQTIRKHMVGYELLAMPQRDITAEAAAERLHGQSTKHYLEHASR